MPLKKMNSEEFKRLTTLLECQSPVGFEAAMTHGFLAQEFASFAPAEWAKYTFKGNAGIIFDTKPHDKEALSIMLVGHADKIRLQVRSIGKDGKIWVDSDGFLPLTLIGHKVVLYSQDPQNGRYRPLKGGTIEAIGAIHFADPKLRSGDRGIKANQLYLELQMYGKNPQKDLEKLGIAPGDPILLQRPISRGFSKDTFTGPYLDNGLGCFVTMEVARLMAKDQKYKNLRLIFAFAPFEEIGRFGSRIMAHKIEPDILMAIDVTHDYKAAPGVGEQRFPETTIGGGVALETGSITSPFLNSLLRKIAAKEKLPLQIQSCGRDTGTDAMGPVFASIDAAAVSLGIPLRNMHTISEVGHTGDVMATIKLIELFLDYLEKGENGKPLSRAALADNHIRLNATNSSSLNN